MRMRIGFNGLLPQVLVASVVLLPAALLAQQYPPQQYPPQQYPPQQQQPYPAQQYPQGQYPPQQQPYPNQQQYPQGQYPPQQGQYPPQQGQYPASQYPQNYPPPAALAPQQLDQVVSRIALYPDGLLAQVFTASTYPINELQDAAGWANQHGNLHGDQLARAISDDRLPFEPSVMALLPFPAVLDELARDPGWTQQLGNAVLVQRNDVMDAVQRMRQQAYSYGYLQSNQYERVVSAPGAIEILPVAPGAYYVPVYDPLVVYRRPRPGFFVGGAIHFGPAVTIGVGFAPFGWASPGFGWHDHAILFDNRPWVRSWDNRRVYVAPYAAGRPRFDGPRVEHHEVVRRESHEEHEHHER